MIGLWLKHPCLMLSAMWHATFGDENRAADLIRQAMEKDGRQL